MKKGKNTNSSDVTYATFGTCLLIGLLFIAVGHLYHKCSLLQEKEIASHKAYIHNIENLQNQYIALQDEVNASRKVYVYNLEEILTKMNLLETKKKFEEDLIKLNDELVNGKEKIEALKNAQVQEDFSEVYLNNLRFKRDELVTHYDKTLDELADKINKALLELCAEKNIPTVFISSAVAIPTENVIDVTNEVLAKIQK